jgi:hypothetical protein
VIDRSGQWWTGEDFGDLAEHLRVVTAEGYPANRIRQSVCRCGGTTHRLDADPLESVAQRTCVACGTSAFIATATSTGRRRGLSDGIVPARTIPPSWGSPSP